MNAYFEPGKHYRHKATMSCADLEHSHWLKDATSLVSVLTITVRTRERGRSITAEIDIWDVSPAELRHLAAAMSAAADSLEACAAQVGVEVAA